MKLFKYEGYKIVIEPEALMLKPFKKIWMRDKSQSKDKAMMEFGFIYFYCDPRSDFQYITDDKDRFDAIKKAEGMDSHWKIDKDIEDAIQLYKENTNSIAILLLQDTRYAVDKLRTLLRNINLNDRDDKGKPIYTLPNIVSTIKQVPQLVKDLDEAERTIAKELNNSSKMRGQGEKTVFEDGFKA